MILYETMKKNLTAAMTEEVKAIKADIPVPDSCVAVKNACRAVISKFPEIGVKPADSSDEDVIKLCKKYIKEQKTRLLFTGKYLTAEDVEGLDNKAYSGLLASKLVELDEVLTSEEIKHIESYIPSAPSNGEIESWIKDNIDFSQFKNKMQAMKPIMQHFGGTVDGNVVKQILQGL